MPPKDSGDAPDESQAVETTDKASPSLRIPYTQQFGPETTRLFQLTGMLRQHKGKRGDLTTAIASAFFSETTSPEKMAKNTLISLRVHGIIDDSAALTALGVAITNAATEDLACSLLAKNILIQMDGLHLVETLREMKRSEATFSLGTIKDELRHRGFQVSDNSSDLSGVLGWLRAAGVLANQYEARRPRARSIRRIERHWRIGGIARQAMDRR